MKKIVLIISMFIAVVSITYSIYGADLFVNGSVQSKGLLSIDLQGFPGSTGGDFIQLRPNPASDRGPGFYTISGLVDTLTFRSSYLGNSPGDIRVRRVWQTSDQKFKANISSIESPLKKILKIYGVSYEWSEEKDPGKTKEKHYGVIAQEMENVLPELVQESPEGEKAVAYTELIPFLIEAVKEQQSIIEKQQQDIENLQLTVDSLKITKK